MLVGKLVGELAQGFFLRLAFGDVQVRAEHPFGFAFGCARQQAAASHHPRPVTTAVAHARFDFKAGQFAGKVLLQQFHRALLVTGVHTIQPGLGRCWTEFLGRVADDRRPAVIEARLACLHIPLPGAGARAFDDRRQTHPFVAQGALGAQLCRHVTYHGNAPQRGASTVTLQDRREQHIEDFAAAAHHLVGQVFAMTLRHQAGNVVVEVGLRRGCHELGR